MHDFCIAIAKSTALHCLAECQVSALPINPVQILRYYGLSCKLVSDTSLHGSPGDIRREDYGRSAILVNADSTKEHQRFIILHEIGHYLMGHVFPDTSKRIREESEQMADIFAAAVLMPPCVLCALHTDAPGDIAKLCGVTFAAALMGAGLVQDNKKRGAFLVEPLEHRVFIGFKKFLEEKI